MEILRSYGVHLQRWPEYQSTSIEFFCNIVSSTNGRVAGKRRIEIKNGSFHLPLCLCLCLSRSLIDYNAFEDAGLMRANLKNG